LCREDGAYYLDLAEHRRREDVEAGTVREKPLRNIAPTHVGRGS